MPKIAEESEDESSESENDLGPTSEQQAEIEAAQLVDPSSLIDFSDTVLITEQII